MNSITASDEADKAEQEFDDDFCLVIINGSDDEDSVESCGKIATSDVIVKNAFGKFLVPICAKHKTSHREFYRKLRRSDASRFSKTGRR